MGKEIIEKKDFYCCYYALRLEPGDYDPVTNERTWEFVAFDYTNLCDLLCCLRQIISIRLTNEIYYSIYKLKVPKDFWFRTHCHLDYILEIERDIENKLFKSQKLDNPELIFQEFIEKFKEDNYNRVEKISVEFKRLL